MAQMTDPSLAMASFQEELRQSGVELERGRIDPEIHVFADNADGRPRLTYVRLQGRTVTAYASFVIGDPIDDSPCFQVGYAVPAKYRNQGRARDVLRAAITELQNGFAGNPPFYVEAVVGVDNPASQRVAEQVLSTEPETITDRVSGLPALHYVRKVETGVQR
ncbi:RimJ/RimL family protein N-acetyltransferase [Lysobacter niastensis]|uniref:RimJ/RimL family protein N-acetyltransferase n=1 Tax=Lysobacter niastensis TaxID=380629 RepID=A0ABU1WA66_9GAMM|nr:GNAT family N-acetyltransferase [Lysobacter niastensis]MDR7134517.1 RimJ/RimL family protein N-acetyltransferase [Lysobacter niastensis]